MAKLKCRDCHALSGDGEAAGFPPESRCMMCHTAIKPDSPAIMKLAEFAKSGKAVPWVRVYRLPDTVWFSHRAHVDKGKVDCSACHGAVAEQDVTVKELPSTTMKFCVDCHASSKAPTRCDFCHNSG